MSNPTPTGQDEARRALVGSGEIAFRAFYAGSNASWDQMSTLGRDQWRRAEQAVIEALRAHSLDRGAEEMKLKAEITCRDLVDHYREAAENHLAKRSVEKAQKAIAWADGAMACGKAIRALPVPADLNEGGGND